MTEPKSLPTCERLRELFDYDCDTGALTWRQDQGRAKRGSRAGSPHSKGYLQLGIDGHNLLAQRVVWCWVFGEWPRQGVDHRNETKTDNSLGNLRDVSNTLNHQNRRSAKANSVTGVLGVSPYRGGYRATIKIDGALRHLGSSKDIGVCAALYAAAKAQHHIGR